MSAPSARVDCGCSTTKAREEGAEHTHYRRGLSPELSANNFFRPGNWGVRRTAIESQQWRSREVLSGTAAEKSELRVGMEATGYSRRFERLLAELGIEVWIGDTARTSHRQGGDGAQASGSAVLDVAQWLGAFAVRRIRFARGKARNRTWRELERRALDWASRSLEREFEEVIMVEVLIGEMFGSD